MIIWFQSLKGNSDSNSTLNPKFDEDRQLGGSFSGAVSKKQISRRHPLSDRNAVTFQVHVEFNSHTTGFRKISLCEMNEISLVSRLKTSFRETFGWIVRKVFPA